MKIIASPSFLQRSMYAKRICVSVHLSVSSFIGLIILFIYQSIYNEMKYGDATTK